MKKLWIVLTLLAALLLAFAGTAGAENTITPDQTITAVISFPDDAAIFEYTPEEDGMYRFYSMPVDEDHIDDTFGYLMDEDMLLIVRDDDGGEAGHFCIIRRLDAGRTYYLGAAFYGKNTTGCFPVRLEKIEGVYAAAKKHRIYAEQGETGTAEVEAYSRNGGLTYQWYDGEAEITGATEKTYTFPALTEAKDYRCVVTDSAGGTAEVYIEARIPSRMAVTASGGGKVEKNSSVTLRVDATAKYGADRITYRWFEFVVNENGYRDIAHFEGQTGPELTLTNITQGREIHCEVADINGDTQDCPFKVSLSGDISLAAVGSKSREVTAGESMTLEVAAVSEYDYPVSYRWYMEIDDDGYWDQEEIDGMYGPVCTINHVYSGGTYYCRAVNSAGNSAECYFYISVTSPFDVAPVGESFISITPSETGTMKVTLSGNTGDVTYQWFGYSKALERFVSINGAVTDSYAVSGNSKTGSYYCLATDTGSGLTAKARFGVSIENHFTVTADTGSEHVSLNPGATATLKVNVTTDGGKVFYRWYQLDYDPSYDMYYDPVMMDGEQSDTLAITGDRTRRYECTVTDQYGNSGRVSFDVNINNGFSVEEPETAEYTAAPGGSVRLSVAGECSSGNLIYNWMRFDPYFGPSTVKLSGENFLEINPVTADNRGEYQVVVYDRYGNYRSFWFYIRIENHVTAAPAGDPVINPDDGFAEITVNPGEGATLSVTASCDEGGIEYQWYRQMRNEYGSTYYTAIPSGKQSTLQLAVVPECGAYYCEAADEYGGEARVYFRITVDNGLSAAAKDDQDSFVVAPETEVTMTVEAGCTQGALSYQWYRRDGFSYNREIIDGASLASYTANAVKPYEVYICHVSDAYGNSAEVSFHINLANELSVWRLNDEDEIRVEPGEPAAMAVGARCNVGTLSYQWYLYAPYTGEDGNEYWKPEIIEGATGSSYTTGGIDGHREYFCRIADQYGSANDVWFYINIDNHLTAGPENDEGVVSAGPGETVTMTVEASCTIGTLSYQWFEFIQYTDEYGNDCRREEIIEGATDLYYTIRAEEFAEYICYISDEYGNGTSVEFRVEIENGLTLEAADGETDIYITPEEAAELQVTGSCTLGELSYQWYVYDEGIWEWEAIAGATSASYTTDSISFTRSYCCKACDRYGNSKEIQFYVNLNNELVSVRIGSYNRYIKPGLTTTLEVEGICNKGEITYQWYEISFNREGDYWEEAVLIEGATEPTYVTEVLYDIRQYICEVRDEYGSSSSTSFGIMIDNGLTANAWNNDDNVYAPYGGTALLRTEARCDEGPIAYQWYRIDDESGEWIIIEDATEPSLTSDVITDSRRYVCEVHDRYNTYNAVWFSVNYESGLTAEPEGAYLFRTDGTPVEMKVAAGNLLPEPSFSYEWYSENYGWLGSTSDNTYTLTDLQTGRYYCDVSDGYQTARVWFYVTDGCPLAYGADSERTAEPGEEITLTVVAWNAEDDITYQWFEDNGTGAYAAIEGETGAEYTFAAEHNRDLYCHVEGTGIPEHTRLEFRVRIQNHFVEDASDSSKINIIPAGGSVLLTANISSRLDDQLTYRWYRNDEAIPGETGKNLTVNTGGDYRPMVYDRFGNSTYGEIYWCIEDGPETMREGTRVIGQETGRAVYAIIPGETGFYQLEAEGNCSIYRPGSMYGYMSLTNENVTIRLGAGETYYIVLHEANDSLKYTLAQEELTAITITLQPGQNLRIPQLGAGDRLYCVTYIKTDNRRAVHVDGDHLDTLRTGSADVLVIYENGARRIYHITVAEGNTLVLPDQLQVIEEDAFDGVTGARFIKLGQSVNTVKSGAFAHMGSINVILDSPSTVFENDVFAGSAPLVICHENSDAEYYCRSRGIPYLLAN